MNVVMISPGYPTEMPYFTRGLARVGAKVLGVGDQPESSLPPETRESLTAYLRVASLVDEQAVIEDVVRWTSPIKVDRVECLWEPGVLLAARLRERLGVAGMTEQEVIPFRNKDLMKQVLSDAGIRSTVRFPGPHRAEVLVFPEDADRARVLASSFPAG